MATLFNTRPFRGPNSKIVESIEFLPAWLKPSPEEVVAAAKAAEPSPEELRKRFAMWAGVDPVTGAPLETQIGLLCQTPSAT
ncbi:hypothetical protein [Fimbriiglobus ruber]|uniref:Uncharacterized protein n=1 Tax=Fimbriiglobus ruber TaxID=1908690 RepID=A0A225D5R0_9BACT|nr:hypothetical protein [Fimbriiglobus ruber]OWK34974.1 hypothetical protein FRUB_09816 [Fimbriiglobus ruber]